MKLFAILFFLLPILGCTYVGWHIWQMLPFQNIWKIVVLVAMFACLSLLFVCFMIGLDGMPLSCARIIYNVGTSSIFILLYLTMLFLVLDFGRLIHLVPTSFLKESVAGAFTVLGIMIAVFAYGNWHYYQKKRVQIDLHSSIPLDKPLKFVMMSDLHIGYHNTRKDLAQWVDLVNKENPDCILIAGDIIDVSVKPVLEEDMSAEFKRLNAPVYACLGNHDYYAGEPNSEQFYRESGIKLLRDKSVLFNNEVVIIGRDDRTNPKRKNVSNLVKNASQGKFTILLDHQPYHLELAEKTGVNFQLSGHTHYGQVWPINWIEDTLYEKAYGRHQRGNTHYYITSGIGIWGGKFRIGTQSEYVVCTIR